MSARLEIGTPTRPTSPSASRRVRVVAHLGRQVERDRQPGLALLEEVAEARVRLLGGGEARVLAHRPEAAAVHRRLDAAREGRLAGQAEVAVGVEAGRGRRPCRGRRSRCPSSSRSAPAARAPTEGLARGSSPARSRAGSAPVSGAALGSVGRVSRSTTRRSPMSIVSPSPTATRSTVPARGARSSFCIFIASTTSRLLAGVDDVARGDRTGHDPARNDRPDLGRPLAAVGIGHARSPAGGARPGPHPPPRARSASRRRRPRRTADPDALRRRARSSVPSCRRLASRPGRVRPDEPRPRPRSSSGSTIIVGCRRPGSSPVEPDRLGRRGRARSRRVERRRAGGRRPAVTAPASGRRPPSALHGTRRPSRPRASAGWPGRPSRPRPGRRGGHRRLAAAARAAASWARRPPPREGERRPSRRRPSRSTGRPPGIERRSR